jgi:nucleotide-binding universal stress UspA family protein
MTTPPRRILVAHDFSGHADAALRRAVAVARAAGAKLHLVHACALAIGGVAPYDVAVPGAVWEAIRAGAAERLEEIRRGVEADGVPATAEVSLQLPSEAVLAAAEKLGADLIALGTRGRTGLAHLALGSVAERIVRYAPCPVLAVKEDDAGGPPRRILAATDFSGPADGAVELAATLARQFGAELHLVHAYYIPLSAMAPYDIEIPDTLIREGREAARKRLGAAADDLRGRGISATAHLEEGPACPAIVERARALGADLVVIGTHGYTGLRHALLGSVAERTLRLAPCAVLAVKPAPS